MRRIVFGISGASGIPLALSMLKNIRGLDGIEIHVIVSQGAAKVCRRENNIGENSIKALAHLAYAADDWEAPPASGSWRCHGMVICPCSMRTLAAIASGAGDNLIHRAADVSLKERRPLILSPRETPLNLIHLRNMAAVTEAGAIIMPFMPAYYTERSSLPEMERNFTGRVLDLMGIENSLCDRWGE